MYMCIYMCINIHTYVGIGTSIGRSDITLRRRDLPGSAWWKFLPGKPEKSIESRGVGSPRAIESHEVSSRPQDSGGEAPRERLITVGVRLITVGVGCEGEPLHGFQCKVRSY